jgi:VanZ family protein
MFFLAIAWIVFPATIVLSLLPIEDKSALHTRGRFHSLGHLLIFGLLAYVAAKTTRSMRTRILLFAGVVLFGFVVELVEHLLYGTAMEWKDVLVDALGVTVGTVLAFASTSTDGGLSAE